MTCNCDKCKAKRKKEEAKKKARATKKATKEITLEQSRQRRRDCVEAAAAFKRLMEQLSRKKKVKKEEADE